MGKKKIKVYESFEELDADQLKQKYGIHTGRTLGKILAAPEIS